MDYIRLGDLCVINSGGTPKRNNESYWKNGDIPWVKISDLNNGVVESTEEFITLDGLKNSSAKIFPQGTLLYTIFATIGEVAILNIDAATNQAIVGLQLKENQKVYLKYIYYYLKSQTNNIKQLGRGVAQNNINLSVVKEMIIPIASLEKQSNIIATLSKIEKIKENRIIILNYLDDLIKSRFVELFGDINHNTKNWPIMTLEDLAELITDGEHSTPKRCNDGIYLLSARNVLNHSLKLDDVDYIDEAEYYRISKRVIPKAGDILLSCSGSVGRCCITPMEIKFQLVRSVALIRFKSEITPIFAEYMITSDWFQRQINSLKTASSQANLFQGKIKKLKGFVPDMNLQYDFIQFVNQINKLKSDVQKSIDETQLLMDSLMQEYFG